MRAMRFAVVTIVLCAALYPEVRRYGAEREIYQAGVVLRLVAAGGADSQQIPRALDWATNISSLMGTLLPEDPRPAVLSGSARMLARDPSGALVHYRRALSYGERPEVDLGLARVYAALGEDLSARRAMLRAAWISPAATRLLPEASARTVANEIARREILLRRGSAEAVPPPVE